MHDGRLNRMDRHAAVLETPAERWDRETHPAENRCKAQTRGGRDLVRGCGPGAGPPGPGRHMGARSRTQPPAMPTGVLQATSGPTLASAVRLVGSTVRLTAPRAGCPQASVPLAARLCWRSRKSADIRSFQSRGRRSVSSGSPARSRMSMSFQSSPSMAGRRRTILVSLRASRAAARSPWRVAS